jgi:ribosome-binding ATPase YchF (GTP1/OBG family)
LPKGKTVLEAAEIVHTDFAKKFIKAEVVDWQELVKQGSWLKAREEGKLKLVGKEYVVRDGEVIEIHVAK